VRFVRTLFPVVVVAVLAGCGEDEPRTLREWTPADHQQPQQPQEGRAAPPGGAAPGGGEPVQASEEQVRQAAAQLFQATCSGCHGARGAGDGASAPVAAMPNMTTTEWQASKADADIARAIRMGQGLMPAYGNQLNERGIAALVAHIRRLGPGGEDPPGADAMEPGEAPAPEPAPEG